jgi:hypothetical protein
MENRAARAGAMGDMATSEKSRTELLLPDDGRLIPAVSATIHHVAAHTGMSAEAESALLHKAEDVCAHAIPLISSAPPQGSQLGETRSNGHAACLRISVLEFPDRVEVVLEHPGKLPPSAPKRRDRGLPNMAMGFAPESESATESANGVDRIIHQPIDGFVRTTLVQYSHSSRSHS